MLLLTHSPAFMHPGSLPPHQQTTLGVPANPGYPQDILDARLQIQRAPGDFDHVAADEDASLSIDVQI